jgi:hypothetical protein
MLSTTRLKSGMTLAHDLVANDGTLLLARDHVLDDAIIAQLRTYEKATSIGLSVSILTGKGG